MCVCVCVTVCVCVCVCTGLGPLPHLADFPFNLTQADIDSFVSYTQQAIVCVDKAMAALHGKFGGEAIDNMYSELQSARDRLVRGINAAPGAQGNSE